MKKLIVLDFREGEVYVYTYDVNIWESPEDFTDEDGIHVIHSDCQWMVVDELKINIK